MRPDDIAIIGMGCLFPGATSLAEYWQNIKDGTDCITEIPATHWRPADYFDADKKAPDKTYARRGGFLSPFPFNPLAFGVAPHTIEATDSSQLLGMVVAQQALEDAGYGQTSTFDRDRVSCVLGVTGTLPLVIPLGARLGHPIWRKALKDAGVDQATADDVIARISDSYVDWQEASFPGLLGNVVAGRIANRLNLGGTNCVVDAACASSLGALHLAMLELRSGKADMAVTGGVDTFNDIFMYVCFSKTPALSPTGDARPFAQDADGTILGEGVGCVILKRLADARRDGDRVYAVIKAIGSSSDGRGQAIYAPSGAGQAKALRSAYADAGFAPSTVELVEAHGTGTSVGDAVELTALKTVFRESRADGAWCAVGSVKSQIGHTKAAAGVAGLIKATLALHHRVQPPTAKVAEPAEALRASPFHALTTPRPWVRASDHPRRAALSSFGFGGSNFHCVLEEAPSWGQRPAIRTGGDIQIVAYSGADGASIAAALRADAEFAGQSRGLTPTFDWSAVRTLAASRRKTFDSLAPARLCLVVNRSDDARSVLQAAIQTLTNQQDASHWQTPDGACFDRRPAARAVAAMFPGQGAQYVGMLRDIACIAAPMMESLDLAESLARACGEGDVATGLGALIHPLVPGADAADRLTATGVAQPALGAVSAGLLKTLKAFDVPITMAVGHSVGELAALFAAGVYSEADLIRIALRRGALMSPRADGVERGGMLAVSAGRRTAGVALADIDVTLANDNAPKQVVIAGRRSKITRAASIFAESGVTTTALSVSAGFHSPLVADAEAPFRAGLADVAFNAPVFPVVANLTAEPYPSNADDIRFVLSRQLVSPVRFLDSVRAMYDAGARVFLEIGPGRRLSGLGRAILRDAADVSFISCDASNGKSSGILDLARALAAIAARGVPVRLDVWDDGFIAPPRDNAMTVPISGANSFKPKETRPPKPPVMKASAPALPTAPAPMPTSPALPVPSAARERDLLSRGVEKQIPRGVYPEERERRGARDDSLVHESILALQKMQQQSSELHRQFLEGQASSQKLFFELIARQLGTAPASGLVIPSGSEGPPPPSVGRKADPPLAYAEHQDDRGKAPTEGSVASTLLSIVSEKTGYPPEMLNIGMRLEWDLGIDSIKRVEIFSALQSQLPAARDVRAEELTRLQTLQEIVDLLSPGSRPPAVTPPQTAAAAAPASPAANAAAAKAAVLAVVSEKTGYPVEMLNLDMTLEWDLGIDSIKRVEIFSELQARVPGARKIDNEVIPTLRTLTQIVGCLVETLESTEEHTVVPSPASLALLDVDSASARGAGVDRLVLAMHMLAAEPARTVFPSGDATFLVAAVAADPLLPSVVEQLANAGFIPHFVDLAISDAPLPTSLQGLVILAPEATDDPRAFTLASFTLLQRMAAALKTGAAPVFATVTRSGGRFGLHGIESEDTAALAGVAGFSKTASREWPGVRCLAIDLDPALGCEVAALRLTAELLGDGSGEIGIVAAGRVGLTLEKEPIDATLELAAEPLTPGELVVVTGGARGVTAEVTARLATAFQPTLLILGRSPMPEPEPAWLAGLSGDNTLKGAIAAHAPTPLSPRELQAAYDRAIAARELQRNLERLAATGANVRYESVDVRDADRVAAVVTAAVATFGPVRAIVHGAGVLADKLIEDKSLSAFADVYDTKVGGFGAIMGAVEPEQLRAIILFSSSTARFGRKGQVDYGVANEALNKLAQYWHACLPDCRVLSLNWGPWDGGMVSPGLKNVFRNEGLEVIGLTAGADYLLAELRHDDATNVEIVVLGKGGVIPSTAKNVVSATGPSDVEQPVAAPAMSPVFEVMVDVASYPVLQAHVLGGRAVVPAALLMEWLALGAVQRNPGLRLAELDDFRVLKGIRLTAEERITLRCHVASPMMDGNDFLSTAEIRSTSGDRECVHARARARLTARGGEWRMAVHSRVVGGHTKEPARAYSEDLFHGELLRAITKVYGSSDRGISARFSGGGEPATWQDAPLRNTWVTQPLVIDCCFQLAVLWSSEHLGAPCLPSAVGRYTQIQSAYPPNGCDANLVVRTQSPGRLVADVELVGDDGLLIASLEGFEATVDSGLKNAFAMNRLLSAEGV